MANANPSGPGRKASAEDQKAAPKAGGFRDIIEPSKEVGREDIPPIPGKRWDGRYQRVTDHCMTPQLAERNQGENPPGPLVRHRGVRVGDLPAKGEK